MGLMAKKKPPSETKPRYPSRDNTKYVAIPLQLWEVLNALAEEEERSVSWMARKAVRLYLEGLGRWPPGADRPAC